MSTSATAAATKSASQVYTELAKVFSRLHKFDHALKIIDWDEMSNMPSGGADARSASKAELEVLMHDILVSKDTAEKFAFLASSSGGEEAKLGADQEANLREMRRQFDAATKLPAELVEKKSLIVSKANTIWGNTRSKNDWETFAPALQEVVELTKEEAKLLSAGTNLSPYEALMDKYEPGLRVETVNRVFNDVKSWLPDLLKEILAKQKTLPEVITPKGPFDLKVQEDMGKAVMKDLLGFDFDRGMLSVSKHPFCGGVPEDVRLTTRYYEEDFIQSLYGIIHETGHARYEQNLPRDWVEQPVSLARSMGIHESQSLFFEMQIGRSKSFQKQLSPLLLKYFPRSENTEKSLGVENMYRFMTTAEASLIRVDADEVTYPLHVILRYEIELALIEQDLPVEDIPKVWDQKMKEYLGIDTTGNFKDGCMQDVHWGMGLFGYFPTYTLGAMYAAQWMAAVKKDLGEEKVLAYIESGKMEPIYEWLNTKVWSKGSFLPTGEDLMKAATGETLNPEYFKKHLVARYMDKSF